MQENKSIYDPPSTFNSNTLPRERRDSALSSGSRYSSGSMSAVNKNVTKEVKKAEVKEDKADTQMPKQETEKVKVCLRIRKEKDEKAFEEFYNLVDEKTVLDIHSQKIYTFDKIIGPNSAEEDVFNEVGKPVADSVLRGLNSTILAYGQTGSGKTFTMEGNSETEGIVQKVASEIFRRTESFEDSVKVEIKISFYEVYMERIRDLLSDHLDNVLSLHERNHTIFIKGLIEKTVLNIRELLAVFGEAKGKRRTKTTGKCLFY
ncbi:kinesin heavy chain-like [Parasteatoda tepidariorum]|uniref:kinesin heavy chain-like n=1 Tax=Parasteatoda tepidariorum TaxID=114398 RepID=UPI001C71A68C|nr:kinesin heavy chain-like [Parasteatoda tepidariorum]